jgi:uncharacterized protein (TIGR00288 family)
MSMPTMRPASKQPPVHAPNAAMLIDFDNVTMGIRSDLQVELRRLMNSDIIRGKVAVQRAYADWRRYPQYIVPLSEASIDLIFAPAFGSNKKNATDIRLAIDAMELVFTRPEIGTIILLSGDSDFSSLVIKLKEYGKYIIGVGIRESSSDLLIQNCDEYFSYNELAGLTRVGDEEIVSRDPWELVVDAILEMKKRSDVMRSDRLKQVMQEIDPSFDEKNVGMSRFSKFVEDSRRRGLIVATKLENGQYEVDLGPNAPGGEKALPPVPGGAEDRQSRERAERATEAPRPTSRGGRSRRGGRGRERDDAETPPRPESAMVLAEGFDLLKQVLVEFGAINGTPAGEDRIRERMAVLYGKPDEILTHRPRFGRFLKQAQDARIVDITKTPGGYEVGLRPGVEVPLAVAVPAKGARGRGRGRGKKEAEAAPAVAEAPAPAPKLAAVVVATPTRTSPLVRRGSSKGGAMSAQIPMVGIVRLDDVAPAATQAPRKPARGKSPAKSAASAAKKKPAARPKKKGGDKPA